MNGKHKCKGCHADIKLPRGYCEKCVKTKGFPKSSFWNNRVVVSGDGPMRYYSVREVHYSADGKIEGWTQEPKKLVGNSAKDLIEEMTSAQRDVSEAALLSSDGLILDEAELVSALEG